MEQRSLFEQWMFEAPGDDPPVEETPAPDMPDEAPPMDDTPPDMDVGDPADDTPMDVGGGDDLPPDLGNDDSFGDFEDLPADEEEKSPAGLSDKVSSILNLNLYQSYMGLLSQLESNISSIKHNSDLLYSLNKDIELVVNDFKRLSENLRLYIDNSFTNERYEKNLLFYNKCKNLNKLLNDKFDSIVHKGIKESQ